MHYSFFDDFDQADYLLKYQADKPRYIPEKSEFLKYTIEDFVDNDHLWNVRCFMLDVFGHSRYTSVGYEDVRNYIIYGDGIKELGSILGRYNLIFSEEKQLEEFINLIMLAKNNTRIWENNGYTPSELHGILSKRDKNIVKFPTLQRQKVGRNDPCPCGSGKKYKKCCAIFEDTKTAQLSSNECRLFYETWYGLMGFVNERKSVVNAKIKPEYAVAIALNEQGEDRLYGIKGISNSIANALRRDLPVQIETVLLPFKGKIIYDSFMSSMPIGFAEGARAAFNEMYDKAIN